MLPWPLSEEAVDRADRFPESDVPVLCKYPLRAREPELFLGHFVPGMCVVGVS